MAKSSRRKHPAPPKEAETPSTDVQEPELYEPPPPETAEAAEPAAKRQAGRPLGAKTGAAASNRTLFQRMEEIPADDWGSRATVHLYRLEPFTDRLRSGNVIHIMRYSEPIDEARVMADHGSGKYRAILNFRKQSGPKSDEVGRFEFEILNTMFPPNVPLGEWVDDPRNKKWAWAKDMLEARAAAKLPPVQQQSRVGEALETIRAVKELMPEQQPQTQTNTSADTLATIKAVRELFPAPAPQTENAMLNTVVSLFTAQIAASQEEARELRKEVREMRQNPTGKSDGISSFKEFVGAAKELLPAIKEVFPGAGEAVAGAVAGRSRMGPWQEMFQPTLTALAQGLAPVLPMVAQAMFTRQAAPGMMQPNPGAPANALPPGQAPQQQQRANPLIAFLNSITPAMLNNLKKYAAGDEESDGEMFAINLTDMFGQLTPEGIDWHEAAKQAGVVNIVSLYRQSPYWPAIGPMEPKFIEFLTQFLAATPGAEEADEPGAPEVIDLSKEEDTEVYA
jgi:hypothetical protein